MKRVTCKLKCIIYSKRKIPQYKQKFARNIAKCHEILLKLSQSAMKFHSNYRRVLHNFARTIAECGEISLSLKQ